MHVLVPGVWTVRRGHDLLEAIEQEIRAAIPNANVMTHLEAIEDPAAWNDEGRSLVSGPLPEVFGRKELLDAAGLEQPLAVQAAGWLREQGWQIPEAVVTPEQLVDAVTAATEVRP